MELHISLLSTDWWDCRKLQQLVMVRRGLGAILASFFAPSLLCFCRGSNKAVFEKTVAPGFVRTPLISSIQAKVDQIASEIVPMKRVAEPQEVADLIIWLCSERSNYVNGSLSEFELVTSTRRLLLLTSCFLFISNL